MGRIDVLLPSGDISSIRIPAHVISFQMLTAGWIQKEADISAMIDTGATMSAIDSALVRQLGLIPFDKASIFNFSGIYQASMHIATIVLNTIKLEMWPLASGELPAGTGLIIGMDILGKGEFAYTWNNGHALFTLSIPDDLKSPFIDD